MGSWLSCKEYTQRASRSLDGKIRWDELPGFWFHHILCISCRRFKTQVEFLERVFRLAKLDEVAIAVGEEASLSDEAAARIQQALNESRKT